MTSNRRPSRSLIGRLLRAIGRAVRGGAEPMAIGNSVADGGQDNQDDAIGGVMIAGAGRRFGDAASQGSGPDAPKDKDL